MTVQAWDIHTPVESSRPPVSIQVQRETLSQGNVHTDMCTQTCTHRHIYMCTNTYMCITPCIPTPTE